MSDNKKYYYLKLKDNYFDQDHIKVIESLDNGYLYSLILLKLYLKAIKGNGCLMLIEGIPYDPKDTSILAKVINHDPDHVSKALNVAKSFNMIEIIDQNQIWFNDMQAFIGQSSSEADRKRIYREKITELQVKSSNPMESNGTNVHEMSAKRPPEREIEKEIEIEKDNKKSVNFFQMSNKAISNKFIDKKYYLSLASYLTNTNTTNYSYVKNICEKINKIIPLLEKEYTDGYEYGHSRPFNDFVLWHYLRFRKNELSADVFKYAHAWLRTYENDVSRAFSDKKVYNLTSPEKHRYLDRNVWEEWSKEMLIENTRVINNE